MRISDWSSDVCSSDLEALERQLVAQPARHHRARDARRAFGAQGQAVAALVGEGVHLLRHDVGGLAERALDDLRELEDPRGYRPVDDPAGHRSGRRLDVPLRSESGRVGKGGVGNCVYRWLADTY